MKSFISRIKILTKKHRIWSFIILIIIIVGGYYGYKKITNTSGETLYTTTQARLGTIISSVSGSGQVSALNQIDLKPKVSGDITYLTVKNGQKVSAGDLIAKIDSTDAEKNIRDAEINLENAQISLSKLEISNSEENLNNDLAKAYDNGFSTLSVVFSDLPTLINSLEDLLNNQELATNSARTVGSTASTYRSDAEDAYYQAEKLLKSSQKAFLEISRNSNASEIDLVLDEVYQTVRSLSDAIKKTSVYINYMTNNSDSESNLSSYQNTIASYTSTTNGYLADLSSTQTNIKNTKDSLTNANLDLRSSKLSLETKQNSLRDAKDSLSDYYIRAPFTGTVTSVTVEKGNSVSGSTTIASLITDKQIAEISLNEVDAAKIIVGQKATLTFDALPNLSIVGEVAEVDSVGTVSQGVVNYITKISFDSQENNIKPGMSVSASIITDIQQDVLIVPNSAVKSQGEISYVETFAKPLTATTNSPSETVPQKVIVTVSISNDTETEITSGLNEGDTVVTKTTNGSTTTQTSAPSIFGAATNRSSGTGVNRAFRPD